MTREEWSERCYIPGFKDGGKMPQARECGWPLEAGKIKKVGFPLESPEGSMPLPTS